MNVFKQVSKFIPFLNPCSLILFLKALFTLGKLVLKSILIGSQVDEGDTFHYTCCFNLSLLSNFDHFPDFFEGRVNGWVFLEAFSDHSI